MIINNIEFSFKNECNEQEITYAKKIAECYKSKLPKIVDFILKNDDFKSFYGEYNLSEETIFKKLNRPTIRILNENSGVVTYTEHLFDNAHIISFEFIGLFEKLAYLSIDG